jgi:hypothetical protein
MQPLPSSLHVEQTLAACNVNGVTIVLGQERQNVSEGPAAPGRYVLEGSIDWILTLQLPMPAVKHLTRQLAELVAGYEARCGVIPQDVAEAPKPTLATWNPRVVTRTESPAELFHRSIDAGVQPAPYKPKNFRYFDEPAQSETAAHPARHPPQDADLPPEPAPSPSSPTPLSEPESQSGAQTVCDPDPPSAA